MQFGWGSEACTRFRFRGPRDMNTNFLPYITCKYDMSARALHLHDPMLHSLTLPVHVRFSYA